MENINKQLDELKKMKARHQAARANSQRKLAEVEALLATGEEELDSNWGKMEAAMAALASSDTNFGTRSRKYDMDAEDIPFRML